MEILYQDKDILVCIKPPRVLSTDEPGGLPDMLRAALQNPDADIRTVHRLDRVVSGLMVLARNAHSASELSRQIREDTFEKTYLAVVHGAPPLMQGTMTDLLYRDKQARMTRIVSQPAKGVQEAILDYKVLAVSSQLAKVEINLRTGRTHQIRVQFSGRGLPLVGERKYAVLQDQCEIALWSYRLGFTHPTTGQYMTFSQNPPNAYPWDVF